MKVKLMKRPVSKPIYLANGKIEIMEQETIWQRFVHLFKVKVRVPKFAGGHMDVIREIHHHGNAAVILPVDPKRRTVLLVRQWRIPPLFNNHDEPLLEVVAGIIDEGEKPAECAMRETLEETGYQVLNPVEIAQCYSSPGTLTEYYYLFTGEYDRDKRVHEGGGHDHEGEDIEVVEVSFDELDAMLAQGEIKDAKTLLAANWILGRHA